MKVIIEGKKQIYYPMVTIVLIFLIYFIFSLFIEIADTITIVPFVFLTLTILILRYTIDRYADSQNKINNMEKGAIINIILIIFLFILSTLAFGLLVIEDIFYLIPIIIHSLSMIIIYYFLRYEVNKYNSLRSNNRSKEYLKTI